MLDVDVRLYTATASVYVTVARSNHRRKESFLIFGIIKDVDCSVCCVPDQHRGTCRR